MQATIGRIVHYTLTATDAEQITRRRTDGRSIAERMKQSPPGWPAGAQAHIGNSVQEGTVVAMIVVAVWPSEQNSVNGQAFLDGNDVLWTMSVTEGDGPGKWAWPPRA